MGKFHMVPFDRGFQAPIRIEFIDENGGGPGVRLRKRSSSNKAK